MIQLLLSLFRLLLSFLGENWELGLQSCISTWNWGSPELEIGVKSWVINAAHTHMTSQWECHPPPRVWSMNSLISHVCRLIVYCYFFVFMQDHIGNKHAHVARLSWAIMAFNLVCGVYSCCLYSVLPIPRPNREIGLLLTLFWPRKTVKNRCAAVWRNISYTMGFDLAPRFER